MLQTKVVEKIWTYILCSATFFENCAVYEIRWKNTVERDRPQMTKWRMPITCCIPKATNTQTQVVYYWLLVHCIIGGTNAPQCNVIRTVPVCLKYPSRYV